MLNLIRIAGDYVSEEVWYRVIQIVVNRPDVQGYAAKTVFEALQAPACHENMVKVGGYILGEFGNLIAGDPRSMPIVQFDLLHSKYHLCSSATRCLLLSTYVKFVNLFAEIKPHIQDVLRQDANLKSADVEIQQRTMEYLQLSRIADADVLATVLEEMPSFAERESSILSSILQKKKPPPDNGLAAKDDKSPATSAESSTATARHQNGADAAAASGKQAQNGHATATHEVPTNGHNKQQQQQQMQMQMQQQQPAIPNSQSIDLLGLGSFTSSPPAPASTTTFKSPSFNTQDALLDIFGGGSLPQPQLPAVPPAAAATTSPFDSFFSFDAPLSSNNLGAAGQQHQHSTATHPQFTPITQMADQHGDFLFKPSGHADATLAENESLLVQARCEYKQNLGRMTLTFVNKTSAHTFNDFVVEVPATSAVDAGNIRLVVVKPAPNSVGGGQLSTPLLIKPNAQLQQMINVECVNDFRHVPQISVQFSVNGALSRFTLHLPIFVNKFFESTQMDAQSFFTRWKNLSGLEASTTTKPSQICIYQFALLSFVLFHLFSCYCCCKQSRPGAAEDIQGQLSARQRANESQCKCFVTSFYLYMPIYLLA